MSLYLISLDIYWVLTLLRVNVFSGTCLSYIGKNRVNDIIMVKFPRKRDIFGTLVFYNEYTI